jgi:excinuclease ABC subunit C
MVIARKLVWKRENVLKPAIPNKPGLYKFHDKRGRVIYAGHAHKLRHRVQSYYQKDCYHTHPTKRMLRNKIHSYSYKVMPVKKARLVEKKIKKVTRYNYL